MSDINDFVIENGVLTKYRGQEQAVKIPESVTSIGWCAFLGRTGLTSIEIPDSVTSIGSSAFSWCAGLTSIKIPSSVASIGWGAFLGCNDNLVITTTADSYAAKYAEENGIKVNLI